MFKTITIKNVHIMNYTPEFAICTKIMELLKIYSKETTISFLLNQVGIYYGQMSNKF